jgi:hypothetical protein
LGIADSYEEIANLMRELQTSRIVHVSRHSKVRGMLKNWNQKARSIRRKVQPTTLPGDLKDAVKEANK